MEWLFRKKHLQLQVLSVVDYPFQLSNLVRGLEVLLEGFIGTG